MTQEDVFLFLKENPDKWMTSKEIAKAMNVSIGSVTCNLKKLRKSKLVQFKPSEKRISQFYYKYKQ
ncbi:MAG: helix-turn-helix domain-containing protein [archaeon]